MVSGVMLRETAKKGKINLRGTVYDHMQMTCVFMWVCVRAGHDMEEPEKHGKSLETTNYRVNECAIVQCMLCVLRV